VVVSEATVVVQPLWVDLDLVVAGELLVDQQELLDRVLLAEAGRGSMNLLVVVDLVD
jgi:hypothetical protein